jgi:voltage-gated potassium channel
LGRVGDGIASRPAVISAMAFDTVLMGRQLRLRGQIYAQLEPSARDRSGLSLANRILVLLIILAAALAVVETEPLAIRGYEAQAHAAETLLGFIFLTEYLIRLWIAPEHHAFADSRCPRLAYVVTFPALIDLLAVLPMLLEFGLGGTVILRFFRVLRIVRLAKLGRMSQAWRHVTEAIHSRRYELGLTLGLALTAMLISATLLYWAEGVEQPDKFGSIPRALWWSIVTLTTVGYGDVYPVTALGKLISAVVAIVGIGIIAMPAGIMAAAFSDAIQRHRADEADSAD